MSGTLVVVATLIYAGTFCFLPGQHRELYLVQGTFRIIGVLGLIWGGIDRYKTRHQRTKSASEPISQPATS